MPFVAMASEPAPAIALEAAQRTLALEPADDEAFRSQVLALDALGASALAAERMRQRPQLFADHERERIEGDAIARAIGWGRVEPVSPETRLAETRAALAQLEALQRDTPRRTNWEATRLRVDALSAGGMDDIEIPAFLRRQAD